MTTDMTEKPVISENVSTKMDEILKEEEVLETPDLSEDEAPEVENTSSDEEKEVSEETKEQEPPAKEVAEEPKKPVEAKAEEKAQPIIPVKEEPVEEFKIELDSELVDPQVKAAIDKLAEGLNKQQKVIAQEKAILKAEREKVFEERIDKCFDGFVNDLPDLGNSSALNEKNGSYRRELFEHAEVMVRRHNLSWEDAIKETVQLFKGKDGEKAAEKKLISKLNDQKKRTLSTPTRRQDNINKRKFATEAERVRATMDEAYKKAGIDT